VNTVLSKKHRRALRIGVRVTASTNFRQELAGTYMHIHTHKHAAVCFCSDSSLIDTLPPRLFPTNILPTKTLHTHIRILVHFFSPIFNWKLHKLHFPPLKCN